MFKFFKKVFYELRGYQTRHILILTKMQEVQKPQSKKNKETFQKMEKIIGPVKN